MSALALRSYMQLNVPLSVLDVSLLMDRQALMAFPLDPGSVCIGAHAAMLSCTRGVSECLTAIGQALCALPRCLLKVCIPVPSDEARG
jgi:hypothetical protein